jgi:FixJ family two-component response regulator
MIPDRPTACEAVSMSAAEPLISIVEDDESLRQAVVGLVRSLGYRVAAYANAEDFLAADAGGASDCVITDIQMPGMSGIDLKLRLTADGVTTPVIMVTARAEPALHAKAMASGAYRLLRKPFTAEALIECLDQALAT